MYSFDCVNFEDFGDCEGFVQRLTLRGEFGKGQWKDVGEVCE